jgi:hypothetical protein
VYVVPHWGAGRWGCAEQQPCSSHGVDHGRAEPSKRIKKRGGDQQETLLGEQFATEGGGRGTRDALFACLLLWSNLEKDKQNLARSADHGLS